MFKSALVKNGGMVLRGLFLFSVCTLSPCLALLCLAFVACMAFAVGRARALCFPFLPFLSAANPTSPVANTHSQSLETAMLTIV